MIYEYQKQTDEYTTYLLIKPTDNESNEVGTELATIDNITYVYIPDDQILPEQPEQITVTETILTDELKSQIKEICPHVKLSYNRLIERIRSRYTLDDEQYFSRISIGALSGTYVMEDDEPGLITAYQAWVEECREIARLERVALGLG